MKWQVLGLAVMLVSTIACSALPTLTRQPALTATPQATVTTAPPTKTPIPALNAPILHGVNLRYEHSGNLIVWQDIWFSDPDGDANLVHYTIVRATAQINAVVDSPLLFPPQLQQLGVTLPVAWNCGPAQYDVTLRAIVIDRVGHQSNAIEYTIHCRVES